LASKKNAEQAMNFTDTMQQLEALGSEQTRKTWRRHGAAEPLFGVKFADLSKLQKRIKIDHALAGALWRSANHDARLLACMIADAAKISETELNSWAGSLKDSGSAEALANLASRTPMAGKMRDLWLAETSLQRAGWSLVAHTALTAMALDQALAHSYLMRIEADIHQNENWTRRTMMYALIAIAGMNAELRQAAESALQRMGKVLFDPGQTACEFPDAKNSIAKIWQRKKVS
jgi:3-methyladenine DNA glycosylase AlkD